MSRIVRDLWVVIGLFLGHCILTAVLVRSASYAYWAYSAKDNPEVRQAFDELNTYAKNRHDYEFSSDKPFAEGEPFFTTLIKNTPWLAEVLLGSLIIFPFFGWWSGKLLFYPQLGGLLILFGVVFMQNIALVPKNLEYNNVADVALSLPTVLAVLVFQFLLLTGGLVANLSLYPRDTFIQSEEDIDELY